MMHLNSVTSGRSPEKSLLISNNYVLSFAWMLMAHGSFMVTIDHEQSFYKICWRRTCFPPSAEGFHPTIASISPQFPPIPLALPREHG